MAVGQLPPGQLMAKALGASVRSRTDDVLGGARESMFLRYLPGLYQDDSFTQRFLMIFESVLGPIDRTIAALPLFTEPEMTPEEFLPWLAQWVGLTLDHSWPVDRQRALIANAVEIYRWRGTRRV